MNSMPIMKIRIETMEFSGVYIGFALQTNFFTTLFFGITHRHRRITNHQSRIGCFRPIICILNFLRSKLTLVKDNFSPSRNSGLLTFIVTSTTFLFPQFWINFAKRNQTSKHVKKRNFWFGSESCKRHIKVFVCHDDQIKSQIASITPLLFAYRPRKCKLHSAQSECFVGNASRSFSVAALCGANNCFTWSCFFHLNWLIQLNVRFTGRQSLCIYLYAQQAPCFVCVFDTRTRCDVQ